MSRQPKPIPTNRLHKNSGQAVVVLSNPGGRRQTAYLGRFGSEESKAEYTRVVAEWLHDIAGESRLQRQREHLGRVGPPPSIPLV